MRVWGFDSGASIGWALIDVTDGRRRLLMSGTSRALHELTATLPLEAGDIVGVEAVEGAAFGGDPIAARAKVAHLIHAAWIGGELAGWARARGHRVITASRRDWARSLDGRPTPTDADVKATLQLVIPDMGRTNAHVRDAIGVALHAARAAR